MAIPKEYIKDFEAGAQQLSAKHLNQIVSQANRVIGGSPGTNVAVTPYGTYITTGTPRNWFIGEIVKHPTASDYSDCRYFVQKQKCSNDGILTSDTSWSTDTHEDRYITVTNLPESSDLLNESDTTHLLGYGQHVIVHRVRSYGAEMYVMSEHPWPMTNRTHSPNSDVLAAGQHLSDAHLTTRVEVTGDPSNRSDYLLQGWSYKNSDAYLRPWTVVDGHYLVPSDSTAEGTYKGLYLSDSGGYPYFDWQRLHA